MNNRLSLAAFLAVLIFLPGQLVAQVDYETQIQTILNARCNSCHSNGQNTFNSSSYAAVMASTSASNKYNKKHVIAGDADGSPLVDKIEEQPQFGNQMPVAGPLTTEQINLIKTWIDEGANATATSNESEGQVPEGFQLIGNYPNPFNPSTVVAFEMPFAATYTVSVYSVLGTLISENVNQSSAGRVTVNLNMDGMPSGIYFYTVKAQSNGVSYLIGSSSMTLLK
jgi:hypothetical protein